MIGKPISGLSDQRYFHVALVYTRASDFSTKWVWSNLRSEWDIGPGRYKRTIFEGGGIEFKTVEESPLFAGSQAAREALATSKRLTRCAYDVFVGDVGQIVMLGTGYSSLTRVLVSRLISRHLLSRAWFLVPKLHPIVDSCRGPEDPSLPMKFTITGFTAFVPGVKMLRMVRLGGADVFGSGLVEEIEHWLQTRGSDNRKAGRTVGKDSDAQPLLYQAIKLKALGILSGPAVSVSLTRDGSYKMWLRKNAINLPQFATAMSTLGELGQFETTAEPPSWSEEE